jgi:mannosyl-3-phosphoglycerate phosphatase
LKSKTVRTVIFADLDGTLLDENYSFEVTRPMIERLRALKVPIVLCSSKTRREIEYFRTKMGIDTPFASENGAAIFIPTGYFKLKHLCARQTNNYDIVELGIEYSLIRKKLERIRKIFAYEIIGFGDMTAEDIARETRLTIEFAELAKQREYTEPFRHNEEHEAKLFSAIKKEGLQFTNGGKYYHLMGGDHNKGKAVLLLKEFYSEKFVDLKTVGVGNSANDLEMLQAVDEPFFISKPEEMKTVWEKIVRDISNLPSENSS